MFCNGQERCLEHEGTKICISPDKGACIAGQACDEKKEVCRANCQLTFDADLDGSDAIECGGDDCDDADSRRFPGATEICDAEGLDEDCDPMTLGNRGDQDLDLDGSVSVECCNIQEDGELACGDDCDDRQADTRPGATESCNNVDDDCDGEVDEGLAVPFAPDEDGDGFGDASDSAAIEMSCIPVKGMSDQLTDCDDQNPAINPAAYDRCDAGLVDDDCSGVPNDPAGGCDCEGAETRECPLGGRCAGSVQVCVGGLWAEECAVTPIEEICGNGVDDDCDGEVDEGCMCTGTVRLCGPPSQGSCQPGLQSCLEDGTWGGCAGAVEPVQEICGGGDEDCDGLVDESCAVGACGGGRGDCASVDGKDSCSCVLPAFGPDCVCGFDQTPRVDVATTRGTLSTEQSSLDFGDFILYPEGTSGSLQVNANGVSPSGTDQFNGGQGVRISPRPFVPQQAIEVSSPTRFSASYEILHHDGTVLGSGEVFSTFSMRIESYDEPFYLVSILPTQLGSLALTVNRIRAYDCE